MITIEQYEGGVREITLDEARRLTERIRITAASVAEAVDKLKALVAEAKTANVHERLGYASWTAYLADVLGETPMRLARDERAEVSRMLADEGMSTRAAAKVLGVGKDTVHRDIAGVSNATPGPAPLDSPIVVDEATGEIVDPEALAAEADGLDPDDYRNAIQVADTILSKTVVGLNGKTHTAPEPREVIGIDGKSYQADYKPKPRRRPLPDAAGTAGWDLRKIVDRIERIAADDRYPRHKEEVATQLRSHLTHAIEVFQDLLDDINQEEG